MNISSITGDADLYGDVSSKIGFQVGGFAEIKISDKFAIQPELLYSAQGAKSKNSELGGTSIYKSTIKLAYLNIPLMAKYYVDEGFSLEAGPQLGFLLSAEDEEIEIFEGESTTTTTDIKDASNSTDFAFNVGAGYDVAENINLGLRYSIGLSNIVKDSGPISVSNSNFAFAVWYKF